MTKVEVRANVGVGAEEVAGREGGRGEEGQLMQLQSRSDSLRGPSH